MPVADARRQALREALESALLQGRGGEAPLTAAEIQAALELDGVAASEVRQRDAVRAVLRLPDRGPAIPALERFVGRAVSALAGHAAPPMSASPVTLAAGLAATVLAILGSDCGVPVLSSVDTLTNSQIEFFYARGALALLGAPIPPALATRRSVFRQREQLIDTVLEARNGHGGRS